MIYTSDLICFLELSVDCKYIRRIAMCDFWDEELKISLPSLVVIKVIPVFLLTVVYLLKRKKWIELLNIILLAPK